MDARSKTNKRSPNDTQTEPNRELSSKYWSPCCKNSEAYTDHTVIRILTTDIDLEVKEESSILSAQSTSFKKMNERLRAMLNRLLGDEMEGTDKFSFWETVHDVIYARSDLFWKRLLQEAALHTNEPIVQTLPDVTQPSIREQELEISGVLELSWEWKLFVSSRFDFFCFHRCQLTDVSHRHKFSARE